MSSKTSVFDSSAARLLYVALLFAAAFWALGARLHRLQLEESDVYLDAQDATSFRRVRLPSTRGRILDRNGVVLADNRARFCVGFYLDELRAPGRWSNTVHRVMGQIERVARIVEREPEVDREGVWSHLRRRRPIPLIAFRDLTEEQVARLAEWPTPLPGVDLIVQQDRVYPMGDLACHVIGYVGKGNPAEASDAEPGEAFDEAATERFDFFLPDIAGRDGIEKRYDATLAGRCGGQRIRIDAVGYQREKVVARAPVAGADVTLTLDAALQRAAEEALGSHSGAAIAVDVDSGDLLALASAPRYDLSLFVPSLSADVWRALTENPERPLVHRATMGLYPPGSIVKPIVALAAISSGVLAKDQAVACDGAYEIGPLAIRCSHRAGHGRPLCVGDALAQSCNSFFIDVGLRMGYEPALREAYSGVGMGDAPEIGIPAASGVLPSSAWKRRRVGDGWRQGDTGNVSIGQGFLLATPLQMARMALRIARGGDGLEPRLVLSPSEDDVAAATNRVPRSLPWSAEAMETVREGMIAAVEDSEGTARRLSIPGLRVAAKTGTAEFVSEGHRRKHAWMLCYAPAEAPRVAVVVLCEDADAGGRASADVARDILLAWRERYDAGRVPDGDAGEVRG